MTWKQFKFCLLKICLLSPSKGEQELDSETAWKSRNSKPSDFHIAGDKKEKMTEKRLTRFICLLQKKKKGANRNKHTHEKARGMKGGLLSWWTLHWLSSKDFTDIETWI